jgi:hypothetical protein
MRRSHRPTRCRHLSVEIGRAGKSVRRSGRGVRCARATIELCVPSQPCVIQITNDPLVFQCKSLADLTSCS